MNLLAGDLPTSEHAEDATDRKAKTGILPSHGITIDIPGATDDGRSALENNRSSPALHSPLRHRQRSPSHHREVKETLNAHSEYHNNEADGRAEHHINQYIIKEEVGRGSFGAVHLAVDQYGTEYAVKEFSKSRLRKRAQSNILRRPMHNRRPGYLAIGAGFNAPLHRHSASDIHNSQEQGNPLFLIKEEIAIMKKLDHENLVSLIEVLDDPDEDSLYMVLEMCKKGVVMKVGLYEKADPYDSETCRYWFRDLILGIEYLHAQGVVHRDIKPDNLLLTEDDVLKIVDFGVSEMFEKQSDMMTAKSAGSPAFLPPELCVSKHGDISGKAADIWSMGITLYCLRFGRIPFERSGVLELYEAIKNDALDIEPTDEPDFVDLLNRLLEKDPHKRITMEELREHPWVTKHGADPLLSAAENTPKLVEPPNELEVSHAITAKMGHLLTLMKAVKRFKKLTAKKRSLALAGTLGQGLDTLHLASNIGGTSSQPALRESKSVDLHDRQQVQGTLAAEGIHPDSMPQSLNVRKAKTERVDNTDTVMNDAHHGEGTKGTGSQRVHHQPNCGEKGHAHNPLSEEPPFLGIGTGAPNSLEVPDEMVVAESPGAAEFSIYDTAYQNEVDRIREAQGRSVTVYLTRRVDHKEAYIADENMVDAPSAAESENMPHSGWKGLLDKAREKEEEYELMDKITKGKNAFHDMAAKAVENTKNVGKDLG